MDKAADELTTGMFQPSAGSRHVYYSTGEVHLTAADLFLPGPGGLDMFLQRSYRSRADAAGWIGRNWSLSYLDEYVIEVPPRKPTDPMDSKPEPGLYVVTAGGRVVRAQPGGQ